MTLAACKVEATITPTSTPVPGWDVTVTADNGHTATAFISAPTGTPSTPPAYPCPEPDTLPIGTPTPITTPAPTSIPEQLNESLLYQDPRTHTNVSGLDYYNWYKELWNNKNWWWWESHSTFMVWDFITLILYVELDNVGNPANSTMHAGYQAYMQGTVRAAYQWCEEQGCNAGTPEGALNWIAGYSESAAGRYFSGRTFDRTNNPLESAALIASAIRDPASFGEPDWAQGWKWNSPYGVGNRSLYDDSVLVIAANLNMIAWRSGPNTGNEVIIPTGCGSMLLHGEKDNYERVGCGNGTWPLK
jgi:hypothetical protein